PKNGFTVIPVAACMSFRNGPHSCIWVWVASVETMEKVSVLEGPPVGAGLPQAASARRTPRAAASGTRRRIMGRSIAQLRDGTSKLRLSPAAWPATASLHGVPTHIARPVGPGARGQELA